LNGEEDKISGAYNKQEYKDTHPRADHQMGANQEIMLSISDIEWKLKTV
jgi:hypothetical protein